VRTRLKQALIQDESGFTLLELLLVTIILGIILTVAVPAYLSLKDRANRTAATQGVSNVVPDIESYASRNYPNSPDDPDLSTSASDNGYAGLTFTILQSTFDGTVVPSKYTWNPGGWAAPAGATTSTDYCVYTTVGAWYAAKHGPGSAITAGKTMHLSNTGDCYAS
jgi:prepilin-type N-terminal cleavage/methylation domain-containing protein